MLDSSNYYSNYNLRGKYNFPLFRHNRLRSVKYLAQGHTAKQCESGLEPDFQAYSPTLHCLQQSLITSKH